MKDAMRRTAAWLARAGTEGQDDYGAYSLPIGGAIVLGYLLLALLPRVTTLTNLVLYVLIVAATWYGSQVDYRQLQSLGKRRARGTLLLGASWVTFLLAALLAGLLLLFARGRGWNHLGGWQDGPIFVTTVSALTKLSHGLRLRVRRRIIFGLLLSGLVVLLPAVPLLREHLFLATALLSGGALILSGVLGRRDYQRLVGRTASLSSGADS